MKRSRRPEYDKKRDRSKKHSQRKFSYRKEPIAKNEKASKTVSKSETSTRSQTESKPVQQTISKAVSNPIDRLKDFEINEQQEKKYKQRQIRPRKKANYSYVTIPIVIAVLLFVFRIVSALNGFQPTNTSTLSKNKQERSVIETIRKNTKRNANSTKVNTAHFIVGTRKPLKEVIQLEKDSTFPIVPHVNVRLFKGFHLYDPEPFPNTPLVAKFSKYYFFYDRVERSSNTTMTDQWKKIRYSYAAIVRGSEFSFTDVKSYEYKGLQIAEKQFTIRSQNTELQGIATLVEFEDQRYFFHFISKEKEGKIFRAAFLKKYLNYYLKIQ